MFKYILQRLVLAIPTLFGVAVVVFLMLRMLPGDPARVIAGVMASEADVERIRMQLGLDQPVLTQFVSFMGRLAHLDLGQSARTSQPVLQEILARLPYTVELAVTAIVLATVVGIMAGVMAATHHNTKVDYLVSALSLFGVSMPVYWLGLMLIVVFAINLKVLPAAGADQPASFIMPSFTLALFVVGLITRMTRSSMLEVLRQDYVQTARAKGLAEQRVRYTHALRNALLPVVTVVGLQFGTLLGGAVLTETVFGWPGIGQLLVDSIFSRDYPLVQGIVLTFSTLFIMVNLAVDILYAYIDPRIHYG
ncbi:MAG TPA: nickel ABC transporter permease [Chloroflexota bacterium]|nr:nickel ABC transporter permease [Chloroflexota bacterium]